MFMNDIIRTAPAFARVEPRPQRSLAARVVSGIVAGTLLETATGWTPVDRLKIGDAVQTLDGGLTRILALDRRTLPAEAEFALIHVPGGSHDACSDTLLVPGQHLLIDTLDDPDLDGAPFALVPALALICDRMVRRHFPDGPVEVITPLFADEEVVFANSGVLIHCPGVVDGAGKHPETSFFPRLDVIAARAFLDRRSARLQA